MTARCYIGTSGWNYIHWKSRFYKNTPKSQWLAFCAEQFNSIEVNGTFYRLQKPETFQRWYDETPSAFRFAIKANRYLTHTKRLKSAVDSIQLEKDHAAALGEKLAVVLWQLPANFSKNLGRLDDFAHALRTWNSVRHTIEFRHESWFDDEVSQLLEDHHIAVCQSDAGDWPLWSAVTTDFVYARLHGNPRTYESNYSPAKLSQWHQRIKSWLRQKRDVYVYFDNDTKGRAPLNAQSLRDMCDEIR
ncbi:MAG: DUF72 domain-containing protein [Gammaproteobacteria bacterium]|jgi:uncharacterized protein YecE (DUF72 family)